MKPLSILFVLLALMSAGTAAAQLREAVVVNKIDAERIAVSHTLKEGVMTVRVNDMTGFRDQSYALVRGNRQHQTVVFVCRADSVAGTVSMMSITPGQMFPLSFEQKDQVYVWPLGESIDGLGDYAALCEQCREKGRTLQ